MIIQDSGMQLNDAMISDFETLCHVNLPQDYKDFMLKNNGGTPEEMWAFDFVDAASSKTTNSLINYFYVIYTKETTENDDLKAAYGAMRRDDILPPAIMPIAYDPFGNIICMSVGEKDYGKVCIANHELEDPETGYLIISQVADTFSEFIDKCYLYED